MENIRGAAGCQGGDEKQRQANRDRNGHALQGGSGEHAAPCGGIVQPE
jgi:hypothetical protein